MFHVARTPAGFSRKERVYNGKVWGLDMAVDPDGGRLLVVFSTDKGVFVAARPAKGPWTRPARLHPELTKSLDVSVQAHGKGRFLIQTKGEQTKAWLLTAP